VGPHLKRRKFWKFPRKTTECLKENVSKGNTPDVKSFPLDQVGRYEFAEVRRVKRQRKTSRRCEVEVL